MQQQMQQQTHLQMMHQMQQQTEELTGILRTSKTSSGDGGGNRRPSVAFNRSPRGSTAPITSTKRAGQSTEQRQQVWTLLRIIWEQQEVGD